MESINNSDGYKLSSRDRDRVFVRFAMRSGIVEKVRKLIKAHCRCCRKCRRRSCCCCCCCERQDKCEMKRLTERKTLVHRHMSTGQNASSYPGNRERERERPCSILHRALRATRLRTNSKAVEKVSTHRSNRQSLTTIAISATGRNPVSVGWLVGWLVRPFVHRSIK